MSLRSWKTFENRPYHGPELDSDCAEQMSWQQSRVVFRLRTCEEWEERERSGRVKNDDPEGYYPKVVSPSQDDPKRRRRISEFVRPRTCHQLFESKWYLAHASRTLGKPDHTVSIVVCRPARFYRRQYAEGCTGRYTAEYSCADPLNWTVHPRWVIDRKKICAITFYVNLNIFFFKYLLPTK